MHEAISDALIVDSDTIHETPNNKLMRVKRTVGLVGLVGARNGLSLLSERVRDPNPLKLHSVDVKSLAQPFTLTAAHSDIAMFNEIIGRGTYDLDPSFDRLINGELIIDLGANIGISAALFASRYPMSHVVAVEPHPRNFALLEKNAQPYDGQIYAAHKALSLTTGTIGLSNPEVSAEGRHAVYEFGGTPIGGQLEVEAFTPDELIDLVEQRKPKNARVGLLKMNIEGAENELLASCLLDPLLSNVNVAIIEAHDCKIAGTSSIVSQAAARANMTQFDRRGPFHFFAREQ